MKQIASISDESAARQLAPLAPFAGHRPTAPDWFLHAMRQEPRRTAVMVEGAPIETLSWGRPGNPGLLLLHGKGAHADWWSFIAPFFADRYHVVALSWSGMGRSGWRDSYCIDIHAREIEEVAEATGLFSGPIPPIMMGHSFGGIPLLQSLAGLGGKVGAAIVLDSPIFSPERRRAMEQDSRGREIKPHRVYATLAEALARFRYMPLQDCENLFITDHIARHSLRQVDGEGGAGWSWRFDPGQWRNRPGADSAELVREAPCPLAFVIGERSELFSPDDLRYMRSIVPAQSPFIAIPDAGHHVMVDQPLALVATIRTLLAAWPPATALHG